MKLFARTGHHALVLASISFFGSVNCSALIWFMR
jgi:hypothetical protein